MIAICSLNVCGLKSKLINGILYDYMKNFDIFCMYETKCKKGLQITDFTCFDLKWENETGISYKYPGIHGLSVYIKDTLATSCQIISNESFACKSVLWIKISECLILGALYLPYEGSPHHYADLFEDLTSDINIIREQNIPMMLMGDFNSRTGVQNEINIIDHSDDLDNYIFPNIINMLENSNIPLERKNLDKKSNNNGKKLINMCKITETCFVNGRVGKDRNIGNLTCADRSTIDYAICSPDLFPFIKDFKIDIFDPLLSDKHSPICLNVNLINDINQPNTVQQQIPLSNSDIINCKWDYNKEKEYKMSFDIGKVNSFVLKLYKINSCDITQSTVNCISNDLNKILLEPAKITGMLKEIKIRATNRRKKKNRGSTINAKLL